MFVYSNNYSYCIDSKYRNHIPCQKQISNFFIRIQSLVLLQLHPFLKGPLQKHSFLVSFPVLLSFSCSFLLLSGIFPERHLSTAKISEYTVQFDWKLNVNKAASRSKMKPFITIQTTCVCSDWACVVKLMTSLGFPASWYFYGNQAWPKTTSNF